MTTPHVTSGEASARAITFLATLAEDTPPEVRMQAWDQINEVMTGPAEMNTMLFSLVSVAGAMWEAATGSRADVWSFQIQSPFGPVPVDQAPPNLRWAARWLSASLNCDAATAADLWFLDGTEEDAAAAVDVFVPMVMTFLTSAVRRFLASGNPFPADFGTRFGGA